MEWLSIISIIVSIICIVGVGGVLVDIWKGRNGYGKKRKMDFWKEDVNYQDWGNIEGLEPVDDWDKKKELD
jgi:hypothetical protein